MAKILPIARGQDPHSSRSASFLFCPDCGPRSSWRTACRRDGKLVCVGRIGIGSSCPGPGCRGEKAAFRETPARADWGTEPARFPGGDHSILGPHDNQRILARAVNRGCSRAARGFSRVDGRDRDHRNSRTRAGVFAVPVTTHGSVNRDECQSIRARSLLDRRRGGRLIGS